MRRSRGFTLIELLIVLVIIALMVSMAALMTRAVTSQQRRSLTATRLANVDAALVQFVIVQRRLPCPANGTLTAADATWGLEVPPDANGCTTNQQNGVAPWRTLALTQADVTDGWERLFTYRIPQRLAAPTAMDMSWCDPAGGALTIGGANGLCQNVGCSSVLPATVATCTTPQNFLNTKGLRVQNVAGTALMDPTVAPPTGAAYVLISHGETGGGGYLNSGVLATSTTTDGTEEKLNYANVALRAPPAYYVDDSLMEGAGNGHFDDIVSRPSILTVVNKASLGPRSH
jgi:prepilin-type N-terminal cleavage/methylation domain-containing protein